MAGQELVRKASIEELCGHRNRALELYKQAAETLIAAREAHKRAIVGLGHASYYPHDELRYLDMGDKDVGRFVDACRIIVDEDMWRAFIVNTPLGSLMDAEEKQRFEDSLNARDSYGRKKGPPEATPENVEATLSQLAADAEGIFRRGLVNAFRRLSKEYRSHGGFKIGNRIILGAWSKDDFLLDVDRVMHVLDGKPFPREYNAGLCGAIRAAKDKRLDECTTDYWRAKWYGNGNRHLWPLRADLVERANKIIAEVCGEVLPDARGKAA